MARWRSDPTAHPGSSGRPTANRTAPTGFPSTPAPDPASRFGCSMCNGRRSSGACPIRERRASRLLAWTLAPKGSHAAAVLGTSDGTQLVVWDADTGKVLHQIATRNPPESPALPRPGVAFAPDASLLAAWDGSGWVDLWSMIDGQDGRELQGPEPLALRRLRPEPLVQPTPEQSGRAMDDRRGRHRWPDHALEPGNPRDLATPPRPGCRDPGPHV